MFKKRCPFCFGEVIEYWNNEGNKYIVECPECLKRGITIKSESNNIEESINLWNQRRFDDLLLDDAEYFISTIKEFNDNLNNIKNNNFSGTHNNIRPKNKELKDIVFDLNRLDYGYMIMPNSKIIKCKDSHPEELFRFLKIDTPIDRHHINEETYIKLGIIRICNHANCLMIVLPKRIKRDQIDSALKVISEENNINIRAFCVYYFNKIENKHEVINFDNFNELYLYLDKVK